MKAIVGLGNPGSKYNLTRHNIGFMLLDKYSSEKGHTYKKNKKYFEASGSIKNEKYILIKPDTYMNLSGEAVLSFATFYKVKPEDILLVFDDINLEFGQIRIRKGGSAGGHNGVDSVIECLNNIEFCRLRFGVGNSFNKGKMADYVLSEFTDSELKEINTITNKTNLLFDNFIINGYKGLADTFSKIKSAD